MEKFNRNKQIQMLYSILPFVLSNGLDLDIPPQSFRQGPKEEPCLKCGKPKIHNNAFCSAECCRSYRSKIRNKMNITNIVLPKWPSCVVVGENVTEEQGLEICLRTSSLYIICNDDEWIKSVTNLLGIKIDGYFLDLDSVEEAESKYGILRLEYLDTDRIASSYIGGPNGWCDWNGNIGLTNKNIGKWPSTEEVLEEWKLIAKTFPFLTLSCQLYDKEHCEEDGKPLIQYDVKNGEVNWFIPIAPLVENIPELPFVSIFSEERNERGCTLEQLKRAMDFCLLR